MGSQSANSNHWPPLGLMRNEEQILARVPLNLSATRALASPAAPVSAGTSDPPKECYFPIEEWLRRLDKERRVPNDTTVYEELADEFKKQGISSTYEIITLEVAGLMHVKGVTVGIAGKLVYWALKDSKGA